MTKLDYRYCAFCKNPREVYLKTGMSLMNYVQALGLGLAATFLVWRELNPKGLIFVIFAMIVIEGGIFLRRRAHLTCPHCGFDPVLYGRDRAAACEAVKKHIEARQEDPDVWLARKPPIRISRRKSKNSSREIIV